MTKEEIKHALIQGKITLDRAYFELFGTERDPSKLIKEISAPVVEALNLSSREKDIVELQATADAMKADEHRIATLDLNPHGMTPDARKARKDHADRIEADVFKRRKALESDPDGD